MVGVAGRHSIDEDDASVDAMVRLRLDPLPNDGAPRSEVNDDSASCGADVELVARVNLGEARALAAFYDRVRPIIDRKLKRLLGIHDADFDDMVQNSLIELIRSIHRFRGDGSLEGWVSIVASRVVYRELRDRRSERRVFDPSSCDDGSDTAAADDAESASRELLLRVHKHLDALDPIKAWTYLLHDVIGHSLTEVAEITSSSVSAAQSRLFRGRRELEDRLSSDADLASLLRSRDEEGA